MASYSVSTDGERYHGEFATMEEAIFEGWEQTRIDRTFWVGEIEPPAQPETFWSAEDWLEHVASTDEYSPEWAEDWDHSTEDMRRELETEVRAVMAAWLDRHGLRPKFFNIVNPRRFCTEGVDSIDQLVAGVAE